MVGYVGRNARFYKDGTVVASAKNIGWDNTAQAVKDSTMDSRNPAMLEAGLNTITWQAEKLFLASGDFLTEMLAGSKFDIVFQPVGTYETAPYITLTDCVCLKVGDKAGETGGIVRNVSGEALSASETLS